MEPCAQRKAQSGAAFPSAQTSRIALRSMRATALRRARCVSVRVRAAQSGRGFRAPKRSRIALRSMRATKAAQSVAPDRCDAGTMRARDVPAACRALHRALRESGVNSVSRAARML